MGKRNRKVSKHMHKIIKIEEGLCESLLKKISKLIYLVLMPT